MKRKSCLLSAAVAVGLTAATASAQLISYESMTDADWGHVWGPPYWTDDVTEPRSYFGKVDKLNYVWWLLVERKTMTLQPGTYIARGMLMKQVNATHSVPIETRAIVNGKATTVTTAASSLKIDAWTALDAVTFTVDKPNSTVKFEMRRTTGTLKQDYLWESFVVGKIAGPETVTMQGLKDWTASSSTNVSMVDSGGTPFGQAVGIGNKPGLKSLQLVSKPVDTPAGSFRASIRIRKTVAATGAAPIVLVAKNGTQNLGTVVLPPVLQTTGKWVQSPELLFKLPAAAKLTFEVNVVGSTDILDYELGDFSLLKNDTVEVVGKGCPDATKFVPQLQGAVTPKLGGGYALAVGVRSGMQGMGVMYMGFSDAFFGSIQLPLDLGLIGMTGCQAYSSLDLPLAASLSSKSWGFVIPNNAFLLGAVFYNQLYFPDPGANPANIVATNSVRAIIGR